MRKKGFRYAILKKRLEAFQVVFFFSIVNDEGKKCITEALNVQVQVVIHVNLQDVVTEYN